VNRGDLGLLLGVVGCALGGAALVSAKGAKSDVADARDASAKDDDGAAAASLKAAEAKAVEAGSRAGRAASEAKQALETVKALEERVAKLETRGFTTSGGPGGAPPPDGGAAKADDVASFEALRDRVFSGEATPDEQADFWQMLREKPEILAGVMKALEKEVAERPADSEARMKLSRAYLAKLLTVPDGPEKGAWSMKAMGQYKAVLEREPNHWAARFHLAFNYSQWPDFLNKRPDAIREFETLRKIQEGQTPGPEHAQTYFQLRQLYLKDGRADDAKAVLDEGLRRFPDDEELMKARDGAK
jgi:tetratricopeptide (TPR) repeat protein